MPTDALHARAPAAWVAVRHWLYRRGYLSASELPLPDFLGIGAQKAGTTWLHRNLLAHPAVFMPADLKEVHFFDKHFLQYGLDGYSTLFGPGQGKLKGEVTPAYSILSPRRIRFVRAVIPRVKLIFLMRNPIERAWSHAVMELSTEHSRPIPDIKDEEFIAHFYSRPNRARGDYARVLANWQAVFPRRQIFMAVYDDLTLRPCQLLTEIFAFLGISTTVDFSQFPYDRKFNSGPEIPVRPALRRVLEQIYEEPIVALARDLPIPAERWLSAQAE
ncbi:MAG: sulfotransferase [Tepidisphaeraceae bacterium]